ncbi:DNA-directed RNA polymerase core subunit rpc10 [Purpureocillium takamizusanense]|uniref:DNA-directed RNA polymerase core subunit rpc10 n=1 Tax=Purpureocillium takamizusanense TaxID=2060973 RepID=A0A9Q8QSE7_9HYPO|nr:DNA-directed RNA polymerase core subunit rpc10 [Purpureocillium takamizusanense]UNI23879.1 DNA-directed RNA polymerase core subunit rpc10 [Purpureocillium takamizusanense]
MSPHRHHFLRSPNTTARSSSHRRLFFSRSRTSPHLPRPRNHSARSPSRSSKQQQRTTQARATRSISKTMPREEYQVPTGAGAGAASGARGATHDTHASAAGGAGSRSAMTYLCGDCGGSVTLSKDALVACPHCAGRVLYKERTKRMVQFEAR